MNENTKRNSAVNNVSLLTDELFGLEDPSAVNRLAHLKEKGLDTTAVYDTFSSFNDRDKAIRQKAQKLAHKFVQQYDEDALRDNHPKKAKQLEKQRRKLNLSDAEFDAFKRYVNLYVKSPVSDESIPSTKMSKALGFFPHVVKTGSTDIGSFPLKIEVTKDNEKHINDIIKLYDNAKPLHQLLIIQTLSYLDSAPEAVTGKYKKDLQSAYNHVHPVVAALFLPKVNQLELRMIYSNIGKIVKMGKDGKEKLGYPDNYFYQDIITDPNIDLVLGDDLSKASEFLDLKKRLEVQLALWESILHLRQGKYYFPESNKFLKAINDYSTGGQYDSPDSIYIKDEGMVLRRLLAAFSLYPTRITTAPIVGMDYSTYVGPQTKGDLRKRHMIELKVPALYGQRINKAVKLSDAVFSMGWQFDGKTRVPKYTQIVDNDEVLFIYVNRRYNSVNVASASMPYNFNNLPMTISGLETLNDYPVDFDETITLPNQTTYDLRSVVILEKATARNIIVGCTSAVVVPSTITKGAPSYLLYDPQGASLMRKDAHHGYVSIGPVTDLDSNGISTDSTQSESFYSRASTRGTVFMYVRQESAMPNPFLGTLGFGQIGRF